MVPGSESHAVLGASLVPLQADESLAAHNIHIRHFAGVPLADIVSCAWGARGGCWLGDGQACIAQRAGKSLGPSVLACRLL